MWTRSHERPAKLLSMLLSLLALARLSAGNGDGTSSGGGGGDENVGSNTMNIIRARGFVAELYSIRSLDNYTLSVYHLVNPLADPRTLYKYPALIVHGLAGDSSQMVSRSINSRPRTPVLGQINYGPGDECLAFMLSNNNFDVWLADARGSNLLDHPVSADVNYFEAQKFWNFSLDEQVLYDIPVVLDFILSQAGTDKLHYIGYSESTFFMFALLSHKPEYQTRLASFVALAPVAYVSHATGATISLALPMSLIPDQFNWNYMPQPLIDTVGLGVRRLCTQEPLAKTICVLGASATAGSGTRSDAISLFSTIFKGASIKSIKHFLQLARQSRFGMYDYGMRGNLAQYGRLVPPDYDLSKIKLPHLILVRGGHDMLSTPEDQKTLIKSLGVGLYLDISLPDYNHLDFLVAKNLLHDVNLPITRALFNILLEPTPDGRGGTVQEMIRSSLSYESSLEASRPVVVYVPDGKKRLIVQGHTVKNILAAAVSQGQSMSDLLSGKESGSLEPPSQLVLNSGEGTARVGGAPDLFQLLANRMGNISDALDLQVGNLLTSRPL